MRRLAKNEIVTITRNTRGNLLPGQTFKTTVSKALREGDTRDERGTMDVRIEDGHGYPVTPNAGHTALYACED